MNFHMRKNFSTVILDYPKTQCGERTTSHRWFSNSLLAKVQFKICQTGENSDIMVYLRLSPQNYCFLHSTIVGMQKQGCPHFYLKSHGRVLYCFEVKAIGREIRFILKLCGGPQAATSLWMLSVFLMAFTAGINAFELFFHFTEKLQMFSNPKMW